MECGVSRGGNRLRDSWKKGDETMKTSNSSSRGRDEGPTARRRRSLVVLVGIFSAAFYPTSRLSSQLRSELDFSPLGVLGGICTSTSTFGDGIWPTVLEALGSKDRESWRNRLRLLEDSMAVEAAGAPTDVAVQYLYAVVMGARTDIESGRTQVRNAKQLQNQVENVLALEPDHPGANYLMGRLNAAVMRLGTIKRFIAVKILGGGALSSASWEEAQRYLEIAAEKDPCVPDHHLELALVYAETDQPDRAREQLDLLFHVVSDDERGEKMVRRGERLRRKLDKSGR
jgi:hypothetical protein